MHSQSILLAWFIAMAGLANAQEENYPYRAYDSVLVYNVALSGKPVHSILNKDSTLHPSTVLPGKRLSLAQSSKLLNQLNSNHTYGGPPMACFEPRHAVIFYHGGKIAALVEICFACNILHSQPQLPAQNYYFNKQKQTVQNYGFSKKGAKRLKEFFVAAGLK